MLYIKLRGKKQHSVTYGSYNTNACVCEDVAKQICCVHPAHTRASSSPKTFHHHFQNHHRTRLNTLVLIYPPVLCKYTDNLQTQSQQKSENISHRSQPFFPLFSRACRANCQLHGENTHRVQPEWSRQAPDLLPESLPAIRIIKPPAHIGGPGPSAKAETVKPPDAKQRRQ